jgi:PTS system nitrogen regulatory IIA component
MEIADLLTPESVIAHLKVSSKKQALHELAKHAAERTGFHERAIFDVLLAREKLGTTGVGNGIAIPHGKLPVVERPFGLFARLDHPIDFDSVDGVPVDLIFLLLASESAGADHRLRNLRETARNRRRRGAVCASDRIDVDARGLTDSRPRGGRTPVPALYPFRRLARFHVSG